MYIAKTFNNLIKMSTTITNKKPHENLSKEDAQKYFKDMLRRAGVTSTWKWEDCKRVLQNEDIWKAIHTFKEKRVLFDDFIKECKTREREEQRLKKDKLKIKFRQMLEEDHTITSDTKFSDIVMKYCTEERWRSIDERERDDLFQDYLDDLEARENEDRRSLRETKMKTFRKILEDKRLPVSTRWKDICLNFKEDSFFNSMEKLDRLKTFTDYITDLENAEANEKDTIKKYQEYKNRENFRTLMSNKIFSIEVNYKTKWKVFVHKIKDTTEYNNFIGQPGSQPRDLFEEIVGQLKEDYKRNKDSLKKILKTNGIKFLPDTTFEQFDERLRSYYDYKNMSIEMKKTLWAHLVKKLKDKEKQNHKMEKKTMKKLYSYLIKKYHITESTSLDDILDEIKANTKFTPLSEDKIRYIFDKAQASLEEGGAKDTSSESGQIKKKKKKNKHKKEKRASLNIDLDHIKKIKSDKDVPMEVEKEDGETSN
jgi:pre-mRNA-processing factor 40